ncbi:aldehyde dehydrogenase family protein [Amycolatopsis taiwanensis]|uniref:Aldehyde dehydrogenase n=1 Tax=Amycolatopsis taiwanensis TaxID=342230 RepID=A0A9W6VFV3_9PSEU|nr:aldehyde dehydrogenase [Amycolatopsis taiwanensis]GLY65872.1 aldehyde dehydrogenase [Amycolatopsis taiwanensis]
MSTTPALPSQRDLIDGRWARPAEQLDQQLTNPDTGQPLQPQLQTAESEVDRAIVAADAVHRAGAWRELPVAERIAFLHRVAEILEQRAGAIAACDSLNSGVVRSVTELFGHGLPDVLRAAGERLAAEPGDRALPATSGPVRLLHVPWGPAAVIAPWNAPTFTVAKKAAFALAAGAPVIAKPSNWAPSGPALFAEAVAEAVAETGAPPAVFQLVHGGPETGQILARDPRVRALAFTGGRVAGAAIAVAAAGHAKALQLELGSNNPVIVRADADVDAAADALVAGFTKLNGQWCESPGDVFVPAKLHDILLDAILDRLRTVKLGSCLDRESTMGPQAHRAQRDRITATIARLTDRGAVATQVTALPDLPGWFHAPTVVHRAAPADTVDEVFGPVLTLHRAETDEAALELANSRNTGLAGYVFSTDIEAALALGARLECGEVKINGTSVLDLSPESTQGFWGGSGIGAHGDAELLRFFRGARIVGVEEPAHPL